MSYRKFALVQCLTSIIGVCSIQSSYADLDLSQYTDVSSSAKTQLNNYNSANAWNGQIVTDITINASQIFYFRADGSKNPASSYGKDITVNLGGEVSIGGSQVDGLTIDGGYAYVTASEGISGSTVLWRVDSKINDTKIFSSDGSTWGRVDLLHNSIADNTVIGDHGWLIVNRLNSDPADRSTAINTTIQTNGFLTVYKGGIVKDTSVTGGIAQLYDGSTSYYRLDVNSGLVEMSTATQGVYVENLDLQSTNSQLAVFYDVAQGGGSSSGINNGIASIDNLTNNGVVSFNNNYGTLNIRNAAGTGTFNMRVAGMTGDFLNITDAVTGQFKVAVADTGTDINRTSEGYHLIHANGSASNSFQLVNGAVDLGAYRYYLNQQGDDWILSTRAAPTASNSTKAVMAMSNVLPSVWDGELMTLRGRLGEIRQTKGNGGVWIRSLNNRYRISGTNAADYTQDMNGVMVGADKVLDIQYGQLILGGLASYSRSDIDFNQGGGGHVNSYGVGGYITWLLDDGYYLDGVIKANHYDVTTNARTYNGYKAKGDYRTTGIGASLEAGKTIRLNNFFIEPYLKLSTFNAASKSYHLSNGMKVKAKDAISYKAEAGTSVGYSYLLSNGMTIQPYAKISVAQELNRHNSTIINDNAHFNNNMSGTTGWYSVGVNAQLSKNWSTYGEINYGNGKHIESPYNGGIGIRYNF